MNLSFMATFRLPDYILLYANCHKTRLNQVRLLNNGNIACGNSICKHDKVGRQHRPWDDIAPSGLHWTCHPEKGHHLLSCMVPPPPQHVFRKKII